MTSWMVQRTAVSPSMARSRDRIPCEFTLERMDVVDDQRYNPRLLHQIVVQQVKARNPGFTRLNWAVFF